MQHDANRHKTIPQNTMLKYKTQYGATKRSVMNQMPQSKVPWMPLEKYQVEGKSFDCTESYIQIHRREFYLGREELYTDRRRTERTQMGVGGAW